MPASNLGLACSSAAKYTIGNHWYHDAMNGDIVLLSTSISIKQMRQREETGNSYSSSC